MVDESAYSFGTITWGGTVVTGKEDEPRSLLQPTTTNG